MGLNKLTPRFRGELNFEGSNGLVHQALLVGADAFAEHVVRPALVDEHDGHEDQRNDGHDRQRVLRRGGVVDGE